MIDVLRKEMENSKNGIVIYEIDSYEKIIDDILGITKTSLLGTVVYNTQVIIIDNIIRVFGTRIKEKRESYSNYVTPDYLIVADDVFGGLFALAGTNIVYFAPDTLKWESLNTSYQQFISWVTNGDISSFYQSFINEEIRRELSDVDLDSCLQFYPFTWTKEYSKDSASRKVISCNEAVALNFDMAKQLQRRNE